MLETFAPAHVVVNGDGDVVYYSARTGRYLEPPQGAPSRQILTMARKGLRLDLRSALREAVDDRQHVVRDNIDRGRGRGPHPVRHPDHRAAGGPRHGRAAVSSCCSSRSGRRAAATEAEQRRRGQRRHRRPGARAARHARAAAVDDRGIRDRARGAEVLERGTGLGQRGSAVDQRGARGLEGGDAVPQRGAEHHQRRAERQGRGTGPRQQRPAATCSRARGSPRCFWTATW